MSQQPVLSLILCTRNDQYMGNSRWRLETTLNYLGARVAELNKAEQIEIVVADWGSETPLHEVLQLTSSAAKLVSFVVVPPDVANTLQRDSPFAEVLALNAAARRARGTYIGRIDQDTLVGKNFLKIFLDLVETKSGLESALMFSNLRQVPYRFAVRCLDLTTVEKFVGRFSKTFKIELSQRRPFYAFGVGIWLLHRRLWEESGGYDESMIYMNSMEIDMVQRLKQKYELLDIGRLTGYDFYHLEHYHPFVPRKSSTHRKVNVLKDEAELTLNPNGDEWGLAGHDFEVHEAQGSAKKAESESPFLVPYVRTRLIFDSGVLWLRRKSGSLINVWKHRVQLLRRKTAGQTLKRSPRLRRLL
ncbi:MAG TPA: hypothetical protein VI306_03165 [Pyrinomonadaceae bacterium]